MRYDRRGHGKSGVPKGPYSMERFGRDVLAVLDALKIKKINWCGLSMGGMVGQWLGANAPDRVEKLVLSNTNFYYADKGPWNDRIKFVQEKGLAELVDPNMERWFTKDFRDRAPQVDRAHESDVPRHQSGGLHRQLRSGPRHGFPQHPIRASPRRLWSSSASRTRRRRRRPAKRSCKQIKGAKLAALDAAHISNMEQPKLYTETVLNFLRG